MHYMVGILPSAFHHLFHIVTLGAYCEVEETDTEKLSNLLRVTE